MTRATTNPRASKYTRQLQRAWKEAGEEEDTETNEGKAKDHAEPRPGKAAAAAAATTEKQE